MRRVLIGMNTGPVPIDNSTGEKLDFVLYRPRGKYVLRGHEFNWLDFGKKKTYHWFSKPMTGPLTVSDPPSPSSFFFPDVCSHWS